MKSTLLGKLISGLNEDEWKSFVKHMKHRDKEAKTISARLALILEKPGAMEWEKEKIWRKLRGKEPFSSSQFSTDCNTLLTQLRDFLRMKRLGEDSQALAVAALQSVNRATIPGEFERLWESEVVPVTKRNYPSPDDLFFLYKAWMEKHNRSMQDKNPKYWGHYQEIAMPLTISGYCRK
ncbi:MAG: hypothetical protein R3C61_29435 [Bacteroidia bacterium]